MSNFAPIRLRGFAALALLSCATLVAQQRKLPPAPVEVRPRQEARAAARFAQNAPPEREEHLQLWMQRHSNLPLQQQERELQNEPGFRDLPPETQRNRLETLRRLYYMNPQQRNRMLDRTETLERLAPAQRQQWRDAVQRLNMLPPQRKHMLAGAILELRELPPEQREMAINSPAYGAQFSPDERQTLRTLLMGEPYPALRPVRPGYAPPPPPGP